MRRVSVDFRQLLAGAAVSGLGHGPLSVFPIQSRHIYFPASLNLQQIVEKEVNSRPLEPSLLLLFLPKVVVEMLPVCIVESLDGLLIPASTPEQKIPQ